MSFALHATVLQAATLSTKEKEPQALCPSRVTRRPWGTPAVPIAAALPGPEGFAAPAVTLQE